MNLSPSEIVPSVGFLGLLLWFGRLYFSGKLVPKSTVDDMKENFKQQIERERSISDAWREVAINNTKALNRISNQNERLLESQQVIEAFILSIPRRPLELPSGSGGDLK